MRFTVTFKGSPSALSAQFSELPAAVVANVFAKLRDYTVMLEQASKEAASSGHPLFEKTGALLASIGYDFESDAVSALGTIFSKGVPYAHIQEYGGETPEHEIRPVNARALRFQSKRVFEIGKSSGGGDVVFADSVDHPGSRMPERSFLRRPLADMRTEIGAGLKQAALDGLRAKGFAV